MRSTSPGDLPWSAAISSGDSSVRRIARNSTSGTPKTRPADDGIANWCSEWNSTCCARWPCVSRRSARSCSVARRAALTWPRHGATSCGGHGLRLVAARHDQLGERVVVIPELPPDPGPVGAERAVQAGLVERQPVVVDPRLRRQPVRWRGGGRERVGRGRTGGRDDQAERGGRKCQGASHRAPRLAEPDGPQAAMSCAAPISASSAATTPGSSWVPATRRSSAAASSTGSARR